MTRFIRVLKIGNLFRRNKKNMKVQVKIDSGLIRVGFFIGLCVVCIHIFSCIWIGMARLDDRNWLDGKLESLIDSGEGLSLEPHEHYYRKYILSAYFCLQTMSTVGYGDINPTNTKERIFAIILMLLGVIAFAFVSGNLSSIMTNLDEASLIFQDRNERL